MPRLDPTLERWLVVAGWSAIVILWHTTLAAFALATWRAWRPGASATAQYRAGLAALLACILLSVVTPVVLVSAPVAPAIAASSFVPPRVGVEPRSTESISLPLAIARHPQVRPAISWIAGVWIVASLVALARLAGGWVLARWIRRRATRMSADRLEAGVAEVSASWRLPSATLLSSTHVEAPVVVGHRAPAILLPHDAAAHLDAEAIAPLIAHELAHVARSDYAVNVAQSIAEALLVLNPGVHWIARRIREAREYCCDDLVVARCGSRPYIDALTTLAGLGAAARARPILNVAGPRLIVRIRRLLQEDSMATFTGYRLAGIAGAFALIAAAGSGLVPLSVSALAQGAALSPAEVPLAFPPEQEASSVALRSFVSTESGVCGTARIENRANIALVSVRFAGVLSTKGEWSPVFVRFSEEIMLDVAPGASATIDVNLLTASDMLTHPTRGEVQATCMLAQTRFANGHSWGIGPMSARAIYADMGIRFPKVDVPRALLNVASTSGSVNLCLDDQGRTYSNGAIVGVRFEPGRFARCVDGRWDGR